MAHQTELPAEFYSIKCDLWLNEWQGTNKSGTEDKLTFSIRPAGKTLYRNCTAKMNSESRYYRYNNQSSNKHQQQVLAHVAELPKGTRVSKVVRYGYGKGSSNTVIGEYSAVLDLSNQHAYLWIKDTCLFFELDPASVNENQQEIKMTSKNKTWKNSVQGTQTLYGPEAHRQYNVLDPDAWLQGDE